MKLITDQSEASRAASRWKSHYYTAGEWRQIACGDSEMVYLRLRELGKAPLPDDVAQVIGNTSWSAAPMCNECNTSTGVVVQLGDEPDYDSSTVWVCLSCLEKALALFPGRAKA